MLGLMATSFKRAYTTPRTAAPKAPAPVTGHLEKQQTALRDILERITEIRSYRICVSLYSLFFNF